MVETAVGTFPETVPAILPHLYVDGADRAIAFYQEAFGAELSVRMPTPDGRILHAELRIGDARFMLCDDFPEWGQAHSPIAVGGSTVTIHLNVSDVDASFARALDAGATPIMPVKDMFWGDRYGKIADPFGHEWSLATHVEDVSADELVRRISSFFGAPEPAATSTNR